jgi:hypothetical protein
MTTAPAINAIRFHVPVGNAFTDHAADLDAWNPTKIMRDTHGVQWMELDADLDAMTPSARALAEALANVGGDTYARTGLGVRTLYLVVPRVPDQLSSATTYRIRFPWDRLRRNHGGQGIRPETPEQYFERHATTIPDGAYIDPEPVGGLTDD